MDRKIVLELTAGEAVLALEPLQLRVTEGYRTWQRLMETNAPADEQEAVKVTTDIVNRVAVRIANALYPACQALVDPECNRLATDGIYCRFHAERYAAAVPA